MSRTRITGTNFSNFLVWVEGNEEIEKGKWEEKKRRAMEKKRMKEKVGSILIF